MTPRCRERRSGYALVIVVLSLLLFLSLWGQVGRQFGSLLRIEEARARRIRRDAEGLPATSALASALGALEVGFPPSTPYVCTVTAADGSLFAATFERDAEAPDEWTVRVEPGADATIPALDRSQFLPTSP